VKLATALRLGRVSNLPTVTSNVLAAIALAGATASTPTIVAACVAMSLMYVAGMFLNDAFDRHIDRIERPERPIPSGEVDAATVFGLGFAMLLAGVAVVAIAGAAARPIASAVILAALIVVYDAYHKQNPLSPFVMGLCRAAVYTTAALLVRDHLPADVWIGAALLLAYLIGLTFVARQENLMAIASAWPLAFLAVPFVFARPDGTLALAIYIGFAAWVLRAVMLVQGRKIRDAVTALIAGISLLDALLCANRGCVVLAYVAVGAFVLTRVFQRVVPGT
jgi:4-hydroxybenzoate polyprenyltransferase